MLRACLLAVLLAFCPVLAWGQAGAPSACGPTSVGTSAAALAFPASGATGPSSPTEYLSIGNPSASNYLCVNVQPGGTAATSGSGCAAGSIYIAAGYLLSWAHPEFAPPAAGSIIASGASTPVTCNYR